MFYGHDSVTNTLVKFHTYEDLKSWCKEGEVCFHNGQVFDRLQVIFDGLHYVPKGLDPADAVWYEKPVVKPQTKTHTIFGLTFKEIRERKRTF